MKKVSFDYDGTLALPNVENFAKELVESGVEVWVITSRVGDDNPNKLSTSFPDPQWNEDLWETCDRVGIPKDRVIFTNFVDKIEFIRNQNLIFHLDDDLHELLGIMEDGDKCEPVNVNYFDWENICRNLLK